MVVDGVIKTFEAETGRQTGMTHEHRGWITDFLYWQDQKLMLSSANDGLIIAWSSGGQKYDIISVSITYDKKYILCVFEGMQVRGMSLFIRYCHPTPPPHASPSKLVCFCYLLSF